MPSKKRTTRDIALRAGIAAGILGRAKRSVAVNALVGVANPASHTLLLDTLQAAGIIRPDEAPTIPTVRLSNSISQTEGNTGTRAFVYTVTRSDTEGALAVTWTFSAGLMNAADFQGGVLPTGGVLNFADGEATKQFTITTVGDTVVEASEIFTVGLTAPAGWALGNPSSATGTVTNDDLPPTPTVSISAAVSQAEGNSGTRTFTYTITRSSSLGPVVVPWTFAAGETTADDYLNAALPTGGNLNFADGAASVQLTITTVGDTVIEPDETFTIGLVAPSGYALGTPSTATGTILNDDSATAPDAPVLTSFSSGWETGDNPPDFDVVLNPTYYNGDEGDAGFGQGDQVRMRWRLGAGAFVVEPWIPYWIDPTPDAPSIVTGKFSDFYDFYTDGSLNAGGLFQAYVDTVRDLGLPTESSIATSNLWQDMLDPIVVASQVDIVGLTGTGIDLPFGYGDGPITPAAIPCQNGDKLVIAVALEHNGAGNVNVTAVDQSGAAIALTQVDVSPGESNDKLYLYRADTVGVTSVTVTVDPTGSTGGGALAVGAIRGAAAGAQSAKFVQNPGRVVSNQHPHDLLGGVARPANGRVLVAVGYRGISTTLVGAAKIADRASSTANLIRLVLGVQSVDGPVQFNGANDGGIGFATFAIITTAWSPA